MGYHCFSYATFQFEKVLETKTFFEKTCKRLVENTDGLVHFVRERGKKLNKKILDIFALLLLTITFAS